MTLDIGKKLDTIAQLLAGAPPGPEEKFLFQKYVYCKEDYTSWVVSLLGDLGIGYTQVDSLVNGLYEYRCECTNDQFNQLILKVELSTNPVLATYKKLDSFSDLIGINVFDMDSYAAGCDGRISKSTIITADRIAHWINVQNNQIVQRQLDLAGSANIGTYSIDFMEGTVLSGSVPVNGSIRDNILYRKQIFGSAFDYSLTNCTIEGWIIDLLKKTGDLTINSTVTVDPGNGDRAYDDDMSTHADRHSVNTTGYVTAIELSFGACDVDELHVLFDGLAGGPGTGYWYFDLYNGSWNNVKIVASPNANLNTFHFHVDGISLSNVTKMRIQRYSAGSMTTYTDVYDISMF